MVSNSEIFFSYAWDNENELGNGREKIINELYESLKADGYKVVRDKNDMGYKDRISNLTKRIGRSKFIVVAISNKYLRSTYCMSELLEIYRKSNSDIEEMLEKIFPIILDDAKIYSPEDRVDYLQHWEAKKAELNEKIKVVGLENAVAFAEDLRLYDEISSVIPILSKLLNDINTLNPRRLSASNFSEIKDAIVAAVDRSDQATSTSRPIIYLKKQRKVLLLLALFSLPVAGILHFGHVSSANIKLELLITELNFTLPTEVVLTNLVQLSSIGASGLKDIRFPIDTDIKHNSVDFGSAILLSVVPNKSSTLTLAPIAMPKGVRLGIRQAEVQGKYRFSFEGEKLSLPIQVHGVINIALPPNTPQVLNFSRPTSIILQTERDPTDLDFDLLASSNTIFSGVTPADSISLLRIDEHFENDLSIVRTVSTISSGTLFIESSGLRYEVQPEQQLRLENSKGEISKLELKGNNIILNYTGSVSDITMGESKKAKSLMPTYYQWLKAHISLPLLLLFTLILVALTFAALRFIKASTLPNFSPRKKKF